MDSQQSNLWVGSSQIGTPNPGYQFPNPRTMVEFYMIYLPDPSVRSLDSKQQFTRSLVALRGTLDMCVETYNTSMEFGVTSTDETGTIPDLD